MLGSFSVSLAGAEWKVLLSYQSYQDGCRAMGARARHCAHGESFALKHEGTTRNLNRN
jgi:hypothetical protein